MGKRIVHVEVDEETFVDMEGIQARLGRLAGLADNSVLLEEILNKGVQSLYRSLPQGCEKYDDNGNPDIGSVRLSSFGCEINHLKITYTPSSKAGFGYEHKDIGSINLRGKTYSLVEGSEDYHGVSNILITDTEQVMELLGLEKVELYIIL